MIGSIFHFLDQVEEIVLGLTAIPHLVFSDDVLSLAVQKHMGDVIGGSRVLVLNVQIVLLLNACGDVDVPVFALIFTCKCFSDLVRCCNNCSDEAECELLWKWVQLRIKFADPLTLLLVSLFVGKELLETGDQVSNDHNKNGPLRLHCQAKLQLLLLNKSPANNHREG